jgi:hypothetical protein
LTGTIWENFTVESMRSICPDIDKLCEAIPDSMVAAQVETLFAVNAMMLTSWVCYLHGVPEEHRSTLDHAPTAGLVRLWNELRYKAEGGVDPGLSTLVVAFAQADGGGVKRKSPAD